jgi:hypothetical protein
LANPGFVLKPHFNRFVGRPCWQNFQAQAGKVFLKVSCAAKSFFG